MKYLFVLLPILSLSGCAENFTWQNPKTWHFKLSEEQKLLNSLEQACLNAQTNAQNQRVVLMNGVSDRVEHTECIPHTNTPLTPQRFEGR